MSKSWFRMLSTDHKPGYLEDFSNECAVVDAQVRKLLVMDALVHDLCLTLRYMLFFYISFADICGFLSC